MPGMMLGGAIRSLILGAMASAGVAPAAAGPTAARVQSGNTGAIISGGKAWGDQVLINKSPGKGVPTLGEIKTLSPQEIADRVLGKLVHAPVASVRQMTGTFGTIEMVEEWTRVPEGCRRLRWNANFLLAPNSPAESAWIAAVAATPEIGLATSGGCENVQAAISLVDADTGFKMLSRVDEIARGKREATFDCKSPAVRQMCGTIEASRAELTRPGNGTGSRIIHSVDGGIEMTLPTIARLTTPPAITTAVIKFDSAKQDAATVTFDAIVLVIPPRPAGAPPVRIAARPPLPPSLPVQLLRALTIVPAQPAPVAPGVKAYFAKNYAEALRLLTPLADKGDALSMYVLSMPYFRGDGVPQDSVRGLALLRRAAEAGDRSPYGSSTVSGTALFQLATLYESGLYGIARDDGEAANWWRRWAKTGGDIRAPMVLAERNIQP